jgi:hypothetical protein
LVHGLVLRICVYSGLYTYFEFVCLAS